MSLRYSRIMSAIEKGSPVAWTVRRLLEAWIEDNDEVMTLALQEAESDLATVLKYLIVVVGGTVDGIAMASNRPYDEVLPGIWQQLSSRADDEEARVLRSAVTAWTAGDVAAAEALNDADVFNQVGHEKLIFHFLAVAVLLAREFTQHLGLPFSYATDGWWQALGTVEEA